MMIMMMMMNCNSGEIDLDKIVDELNQKSKTKKTTKACCLINQPNQHQTTTTTATIINKTLLSSSSNHHNNHRQHCLNDRRRNKDWWKVCWIYGVGSSNNVRRCSYRCSRPVNALKKLNKTLKNSRLQQDDDDDDDNNDEKDGGHLDLIKYRSRSSSSLLLEIDSNNLTKINSLPITITDNSFNNNLSIRFDDDLIKETFSETTAKRQATKLQPMSNGEVQKSNDKITNTTSIIIIGHSDKEEKQIIQPKQQIIKSGSENNKNRNMLITNLNNDPDDDDDDDENDHHQKLHDDNDNHLGITLLNENTHHHTPYAANGGISTNPPLSAHHQNNHRSSSFKSLNNLLIDVSSSLMLKNKSNSKKKLMLAESCKDLKHQTSISCSKQPIHFTLPRNLGKQRSHGILSPFSLSTKDSTTTSTTTAASRFQRQLQCSVDNLLMSTGWNRSKISNTLPFGSFWSSATTITGNHHNTNNIKPEQRSIQSNRNGGGIAQFLINYKGADWRNKQLIQQAPPHDEEILSTSINGGGQQKQSMIMINSGECKFLRQRQKKAIVKSELYLLPSCLEQFSSKSHNVTICQKCQSDIQSGSHCVKITLQPNKNSTFNFETNRTVVNSASLPFSFFYHIDCFVCAECQQFLVDLKAYVHQNGKTSLKNPIANQTKSSSPHQSFDLFCSRHFLEIFKPRCPSCDRLIFDEECTEAEGRAWHIGHFCCIECKRSLGGQQYIMANPDGGKDEVNNRKNLENFSKHQQQMPYCLTCFDILFGELCEECGELIGCEVGAIMHEGRSWHANNRCFRCSLCLKSLLGKPFLPALDGRIYCSVACSQAMISHQKERLRRQNRLQTLQHHKIDKIGQREQSSQPTSFDHDSSLASFSEVKDSSEKKHLMKSMTLDRPVNSKKLTRNRDVMNLSTVNYEEFIKKNHKFFTSKYDWSKEQEFLNVIDSQASSSDRSSSQTTTINENVEEDVSVLPNTGLETTTEESTVTPKSSSKSSVVQQQESSNTAKYISSIETIQNSNNNRGGLGNDNQTKRFEWIDGTIGSMLNKLSQIGAQTLNNNSTNNSDSQSNTGSHLDDCDLTQANIHYSNIYNSLLEGKGESCSLMNSPASSVTSPPPEYSKLAENDTSSSEISSTNTNKNFSLPTNELVSTTENNHRPLTRRSQFELLNRNQSDSFTNIHLNHRLHQASTRNPCQKTEVQQTTSLESSHLEKLDSIQKDHRTPKISRQKSAKSVTFDPKIEEKKTTITVRHRRSHRIDNNQDDFCSDDDDSCSSCSTCSSSSDDEDDDDDEDDYEAFDLSQFQNSFEKNTRKGLEKNTKFNQHRHHHEKPQPTQTLNENNPNDSCTIS